MNPSTFPITKERIHLFAPGVHIGAIATLNSKLTSLQLHNALTYTIEHHQILCSKIQIEEDGSASFIPTNHPHVVFESLTSSYEETMNLQKNIPFNLEKGESIRFFYAISDTETKILIIMHHLYGDANSLILFMNDLLCALNKENLPFHPIEQLDPANLPPHPKTKWLTSLLMRSLNTRWKKTHKIFNFNDYHFLYPSFTKNYDICTLINHFESDTLARLKKLASQNQITLNSLLVTALAEALSSTSLGITVDIKPSSFTGMGNYSTGISIISTYSKEKTFLQNAQAIHKLIYAKLDSPKEKYMLYEFMTLLNPSLIDSIYFTLAGQYQNDISTCITRMCGYSLNPEGTSLSNLTTLKLTEKASWQYTYNDLFFIPPYIHNAKRFIGISTYKNVLTLTSTFKSEYQKTESILFEAVCTRLNELSS